MVADERSGPLSGLSSSPGVSRADGDTQSASFDIGGLRLELTASPGAARLSVSADGSRDTYVVEPAALVEWAAATRALLSLGRATAAEGRAEFRAPFLVDREGRASIAFEGLVSEHGVSFRMLLSGATDRVAGIMTTAEMVRGVAEAAAGAGIVASS